MLKNIRDDIDQMYQFGEKVVKSTKSLIDKVPQIATGLGIASSIPYVGPVARGILKGTAKGLGTFAKMTPSVAKTIIKKPGKLLLIPAAVEANNLYSRGIGKTAGLGNVNMGWLTGNLPEADKKLLQRKSFRVSDLIIPHHQVRLASKILRPSWFEKEPQSSERS